jgi:hypothetical protein
MRKIKLPFLLSCVTFCVVSQLVYDMVEVRSVVKRLFKEKYDYSDKDKSYNSFCPPRDDNVKCLIKVQRLPMAAISLETANQKFREAIYGILLTEEERKDKERGNNSTDRILGILVRLLAEVKEKLELHTEGDENSATTGILDEKATWAITVNRDVGRITLVFRGSGVLEDWLTDFNICLTKLQQGKSFAKLTGYKEMPENIKIHGGFYEALEAVKGKIFEGLRNLFLTCPGYKLYVTGHSLGAALSTLFAFEVASKKKLPRPVVNVSFASPRVGNAESERNLQN